MDDSALDMQVTMAREVAERAYVPASGFRVGAVLVTDGASLSVTESTIVNTAGWGIYALDGAVGITESGNTFSNNSSGDVRIADGD